VDNPLLAALAAPESLEEAMTTQTILEAAARALEDRWNNNRPTGGEVLPLSTGEALQAILAAVTPLIRANTLEEAAQLTEKYRAGAYEARQRIAAAIRALNK
jgi:hypothetical protein